MNIIGNLTKAALALTGCAASSLALPVVYFGTAGTDRVSAVTADPATGEFYLAGTAYTGAATKNDLYVTKFSPVGVPMWTYFTGGAGDDAAYDIVLQGGAVYVAGTVQPGPASDTNAIVLRLSAAAGAPAGSQVVATPLNDGGKFVRLDPAGNIYLGGYSGAGNRNFLLAKFTPGFVPIFNSNWGAAPGLADEPRAMALSANGVYLVGTATSAAGDLDGAVARFSPITGALVSLRGMPGTAGLDDGFNDIAIDGAGQVYLAGTRNMAGVGEEVRVLKFNAALTFNIWANSINYAPGAGYDRPNRLRLTAGNAVTVGGRSWNAVGVGYDAFVTRMSRTTGAMGAPWFYNFIDHDEVVDLAEGSIGDLYALIYTDGAIGHDIATARVDAGPTSPWVRRFNNFNHDEPDCMAMAGPGRLVVSGASENPGLFFDWCSMGWDPNGVALF